MACYQRANVVEYSDALVCTNNQSSVRTFSCSFVASSLDRCLFHFVQNKGKVQQVFLGFTRPVLHTHQSFSKTLRFPFRLPADEQPVSSYSPVQLDCYAGFFKIFIISNALILARRFIIRMKLVFCFLPQIIISHIYILANEKFLICSALIKTSARLMSLYLASVSYNENLF